MASKIIFSRSNTEKMAALLVSHSALDSLGKNRKLICGWLMAGPFAGAERKWANDGQIDAKDPKQP
jgi:hypothetical protein